MSENHKYAYVVDFGNRTFKFSNFDNKSHLNDVLKSLSQTPTAEYACSDKGASTFMGGQNWDVSVENCNYITYSSSIPLSSTVFNRVQEAGNVMAYTTTLRLFRASSTVDSRTRTR